MCNTLEPKDIWEHLRYKFILLRLQRIISHILCHGNVTYNFMQYDYYYKYCNALKCDYDMCHRMSLFSELISNGIIETCKHDKNIQHNLYIIVYQIAIYIYHL